MLNFLKTAEQVLGEPIIPHGPVIALYVRVFLRISELSMDDDNATLVRPFQHRFADAFWAIIATQAGKLACRYVTQKYRTGRSDRHFGQFGEPSGDARVLLIECGYHDDLSSIDKARFAVQRILTLSGIMEADRLPPTWSEQHRKPILKPTVLTVTEPVMAKIMDFTFTEPW